MKTMLFTSVRQTVLFFLFLFSFCIIILVPSKKTYANSWHTTLGFWDLNCQQQKFPSKLIARRYNDGVRYNIQVCTATQSISEAVDHKHITFTIRLTPFNISFTSQNITPKKRSVKLIVGPYHYTLFPNCYNTAEKNYCVFSLTGAAQKKSLLSNLRKHDSCSIQLTDEIDNEPLEVIFSLDQFTKVQKIMNNSQQKIEDVFKQFSAVIDQNEIYQIASTQMFHENI